MTQNPLLFVLPALLAATACGYGDHTSRADSDYDTGRDCGSETQRGVIDTDATLSSEAGSGVGVFVEYAAGGHWHIYTSCDTDKSGFECAFDVIAKPVAGATKITAVQPDRLEHDDSVALFGADLAQMVAHTDVDFDGFFLDTDPGAVLSVDAFLDGACTNYVYWVGDGAVHDGAPSSPIEFEPSSE